ncbi:peptide chain release factor N(5)-glutamine methyltransferase [Chryseosolibacter indicus]|uniref:Release factor glutamine methyltransferase n=1 Tax=Chryseosolibacter indicus TaxID=2782351 RepID=A0ABS5VYN1_9BACT|nr:peptide chain release factor N(5)-glutamine methyltransferase [Chryseosolibacter indicus]MBT1706034.1 peptide chain release factor N(5)-glutamine methyltransferase [Chryseosolibacter indicus]
MKNSKALFQEIVNDITEYDREEAQYIALLLLEHVLGLTRTQLLAEKQIESTPGQEALLKEAVERLNRQEPIQYILKEASFFGRKFMVSPSVLIPRPETEELVLTAINHLKSKDVATPRILDIGTGSGCIAITLACEVSNAQLYASDISHEALAVAKENATTLGANIDFIYHSILKQPLPYAFFDVIVSNPPYITEMEQAEMSSHVLNHEPHLALFVPDDDPLIFYRAIAREAKTALRYEGLLAVEINWQFGKEVALLFEQNGFAKVEIVKDISGKDRIVKGVKEL